MTSKPDDFEQRLAATEKIRKLMAMAAGNANQNEAEAFMAGARKLADQYGIDLATLRVVERRSPMTATKWGGMMSAIRRWAPGEDNEDYTKGKRRRDDT